MLTEDEVIPVFGPGKLSRKLHFISFYIGHYVGLDMVFASYCIKNNPLAYTHTNGMTGSYDSSIFIF